MLVEDAMVQQFTASLAFRSVHLCNFSIVLCKSFDVEVEECCDEECVDEDLERFLWHIGEAWATKICAEWL